MNSDSTSVSSALIIFIKDNLLAENISIDENTSFESLGLDSFSIIEIVLFIERKFGVELSDNDLTKENMHSVHSVTKCIQKYLN